MAMYIKVAIRTAAPIAVVTLLSLPISAPAQVFKCIDSSGKITFSDQGCAAGHSAAAIDVAPANTLDSSQYRNPQPQPEVPDRVAPSVRSGVQVNVVGGDNDAERERKRLCKEASTPYPGSRGGLTSAQLAAAAQLCAGVSVPMPTTPAPAGGSARRAPTAPGAPGVLTSCDDSGCWDSNGARYNRGAGNTHFPANGGPACELVGGNMVCP
ncbi:DUF4124 domain-containing protein [Pseudomonas aeruginosa]|uniref:DUF4124 domain-containing protein n=2 Tax=Pseudomonas aeruginosa TaxID=287 RepID=UPI000F88C581|nr:DUF4124 domain-containing protein [Pseudomonas aeruginosa]